MFTLHALFDKHPSLGNCDDFKLLNPYIRCEPDENVRSKKEFTDFKGKLEERIYALIGQKKITHASVYLRDLQLGPWMGIDEEETYSAASLLKVAVLLTVYRQEELHPGTLQQRIEVSPEMISGYVQDFAEEPQLVPGKTYTIDELADIMIIHSDNDATNVLNSYLDSVSGDGSPMLRTLEELGFIGQYKQNDKLTVKQSASLFRLLYNSSYLGKDMSYKALQLLTRTTFKEGLHKGVPASIKVAHKFGERQTENGERQLHDCGVVYHPKNHYMLCIMTRGNDPRTLTEVIAEISSLVYEEMNVRTSMQ